MKTALLLFSLGVFAFAAQAQNSAQSLPDPSVSQPMVNTPPADPNQKPQLNPQDRAAKTADRLTKKLALTQKQHDDVYQVLLAQYKQIEVIKAQNPSKSQIVAVKQESDAKLQQILGADKYAQLQAMRQQRKGRRGQGQPGGPADE